MPPYLLYCLQSYLSGRRQSVRGVNTVTEPHPVLSRVAQGSILGPLMFIAFINSVAKSELSNGSKLILYSDDLALVKPVHSPMLENKLSVDMETVSNCFAALNLSINRLKNEVHGVYCMSY